MLGEVQTGHGRAGPRPVVQLAGHQRVSRRHRGRAEREVAQDEKAFRELDPGSMEEMDLVERVLWFEVAQEVESSIHRLLYQHLIMGCRSWAMAVFQAQTI